MALNINGTTGISGVDGSASAPALQGTDSNTGINFASDTVNINTGGSTRYSVDSSGNIQAGGANPVFTGSSLTSFKIAAPNGGSRYFFGEIANSANAALSLYDSNGSQKIRISADGDDTFFNGSNKVLIKTTTDFFGGTDLGVNGQFSVGTSGSGYRRMYFSGSLNFFFWNGTNQPYINNAGAFINASDENLKKDVSDLNYGINELKNLKPRKYKMKSDNKEQIGFIAQEVESVIPEVVDTDETPEGVEQKGLSYGNLTAVLTKALQEAVAKIETLETKVAALEAG